MLIIIAKACNNLARFLFRPKCEEKRSKVKFSACVKPTVASEPDIVHERLSLQQGTGNQENENGERGTWNGESLKQGIFKSGNL